jgi:ferredoxin-type protein NapH
MKASALPMQAAAAGATASGAPHAAGVPDVPDVRAPRFEPWLRRRRWLLARRTVQLAVLALFLLGPWAGIWIIKGSLASSLTLDVLPLTDPFVLSQALAAGHWPPAQALWGALFVILVYALVGGRSYCAWVCPVNMVTDAAAALRRRLGWRTGALGPTAQLRHWLLAAVLLACAASGVAVWEWVNPVTLTQRAILFGGTFAWGAAIAVFFYDLLVAPRGWCGHLCPQGAAYALIGRASVLRVAATHASRCDDCADCFAVCPEPQVIVRPLKGKDGASPVVADAACTNCARCIDVCERDVFRLTHRWDSRRD